MLSNSNSTHKTSFYFSIISYMHSHVQCGNELSDWTIERGFTWFLASTAVNSFCVAQGNAA